MTFEEKLSKAVAVIYYAICQHSPYYSTRSVPQLYTPLLKDFVDDNTDVIERTWFFVRSINEKINVASILVETNDDVNRQVKYLNYSWAMDDESELHAFVIPKEYLKSNVPHVRMNADAVFSKFMLSLFKQGEDEFLRKIALFSMTVVNRYIIEDYGKTYTVADGTRLMKNYFKYFENEYEMGRLPENMVFDFASELHNGYVSFKDINDFSRAYFDDQKDVIVRMSQLIPCKNK